MSKKVPFTVIDGTAPPDTPLERMRRRLRENKPADLVRCPRCSSNLMVQIKIGMFWSNKRPVGGQKQLICAKCLGRDEYVVVHF